MKQKCRNKKVLNFAIRIVIYRKVNKDLMYRQGINEQIKNPAQ